jgi:virulence-associated protein VagC
MTATNSTAKPLRGSGVKVAKLFMNGRSQAVRLPKEFRFEGTEVAIRRNPATGEVLLSAPAARPTKPLRELVKLLDSRKLSEGDFEREVRKLGKLTARELFEILDWAEFPEAFMRDRKVHKPRKLDLF